MDKQERICVIGLGYIGLPTASLLATRGFAVHGVDIHKEIVETINNGDVHIVEPELDTLVRASVHSGNLKAGLEPVPADIFVIAVPTPFKDDHVPDLSYIDSAVTMIAPHVQPGNLVVLESTSPVETTERVATQLAERRTDLHVASRAGDNHTDATVKVAHCPERVLPGQILRELVENDRIIGGIDAPSAEAATAFYKQFVSGQVLQTDSRTAELAKLSENAYRDVNIAFANELSVICNDLEIDVWELTSLANRHPRVNILNPGPGVGGHCIAVDPWFIVDSAGEKAALIRQARQVNDAKPAFVVGEILAAANQGGAKSIALLGLAYKANIDDLRESPAIEVCAALARAFAGTVLAVEPHIQALPTQIADLGVELTSYAEAQERADMLIMLVAHNQFTSAPPNRKPDGTTVLDFCGGWS